MKNSYPIIIHIPILLSLVVLISSHDVYSQTVNHPLGVVISRQDVITLGGWPLERRWYGIAIQKLLHAGAKRIFIDIAFPSADILHPESDEFFFMQLGHASNVYLLASDVWNNDKKSIILGTKQLQEKKFFSPFSNGLRISDEYIDFTAGKETMVDYFIQPELSQHEILIQFPSREDSAHISFIDVLYNTPQCSGRDVIIYLEYPGITSFIVASQTSVYSTGQLQLWTINQIQNGNYKTIIPFWKFALLVLVILTPLCYDIMKGKKSHWSTIISVLLWLVFTITMLHWKIYFSFLWIVVLGPSVMYSILLFALKLQEKQKQKNETQHKSVSSNETGIHTDRLKELEYRLEYYERLSSQIPIEELKQGYESHGIWCHKDSPLVEILLKAERVATSDISVIIRGESGTGKEMLAQFIHKNSHRKGKPIIAVNCGALNDNLIEAELFGYEKGAFTGAYQQKIGRFEMADGGTLFLDEVSETSLSFQVKLLRVLQEGTVERVGGTKSIPVSVRIITATHQDLLHEVHKKFFREDLFYRLNGYEFVLPALRERPMDIEYLFKRFLYDVDKDIKFSEPMLKWLKTQHWQGNIRQLKASIQRAVINAQIRKRSFLIPRDFELGESRYEKSTDAQQLADQVLKKLRDQQFHHRSISAAATELMIHRSTVTEYLRGWTIKFLKAGNGSREFVMDSIRGTAPVTDTEQLMSRIEEYIAYVETRINEGLISRQTDEEIITTRFRNIPIIFKADLLSLIQKHREIIERDNNMTSFSK